MKVEIGCGLNKRIKDAIGVDLLPLDGVDIVADLNQGMSFFSDNSVDEIYSHHVLEHLANFPFFMEEAYRVLKPGGIFWGEVPHFSNPYFYSDPTHKCFFGLYTLNYFSKTQGKYRRKVPCFYNKIDFEVMDYKLVFKTSSKEHRFRARFFRVMSSFFNKNVYRQELYEEIFSKFFFCYELQFKLIKSS